MSFPTEKYRKQHEDLIHKEMLKQGALLLLDKICNTNSSESLNKKILKTSLGIFSYKEAKEKSLNNSEESKLLLKILQNIVETYLKQYPDHGIEQMVKVADFNIS